MNPFLRTPILPALLLASSALLVGCGNDDNDNSDSTTTTDLSREGTFVDSPVDGLKYQGPTHSGFTSGGGHYTYEEGETVTFYIGRVKLGTLKGSIDKVSPKDFFSEVDISDQRLLNMIVLLQSLDDDGDVSGGITITGDAAKALENALEEAGYDLATLDLSAMSEEDAATFKTALAGILADVIAETDSTEDHIVSEEEAVENLKASSGDITLHKNVSRTPLKGSADHSVTYLTPVVNSKTSAGVENPDVKVHPLLVTYTDTVTGDFQKGTGSAQIPDIEHVSDVFVSVSLDNGSTFKTVNISKTADKSSIKVNYYGNGELLDYYGHSQNPVVKTEGNNILVAWQDRFCQSGNPLELANTGTEEEPEYADDLYLVNGPQGTIDYEGAATYDGEVMLFHEVPFNCIMTARGVYDAGTNSIIWHAPEQLTTGRRDANKIVIGSSAAGFVMAWQEDPDGLRPGKGAGPGDGWSGASTNHQADIWYSYIKMDDFDDVDGEVVDGDVTKPKSLNNLSYPVRVTDNAVCKADNSEGALYCVDLCTDNGSLSDEGSSDDGKCYSSYNDPITEIYAASEDHEITVEQQLLNGDTGASRPVIGLWGTRVILGYEETKGLAENIPGVPGSDSDPVPVEQEGKIAYAHSFEMDAPDTIAPGSIVNPLRENPEGVEVLENVRRLTLVAQVDAGNEATLGEDFLWGIMYKSGTDTRGEPSDMYVRLSKTWDVSGLYASSTNWNLSSRNINTEDDKAPGSWSADNLDDATWENNLENTFSPRGFMRGSMIVIGYEYTPNYTVAKQGHLPNNFYMIRSFDNGETWLPPQNITNITNNTTSTLDPRMMSTSERVIGSPLASDVTDPMIMAVSYGTYDLETGEELDLFVTRSTDGGETWEKVPASVDGEPVNEAITKTEAAEMEVQGFLNPDGQTLFSIWLQELDPEEASESAADHILGSDIWIQRKDYVQVVE